MKSLLDLTPYPDEVAELANFGGFPLEIAHTAVLGAVNAAANLLYNVATPNGQTTHIGLYLHCTAQSGTGKSTIHHAVWEPHEVADDKLLNRWKANKSRRGRRSMHTPLDPRRLFGKVDRSSILQVIVYGRGAAWTDHGGDPSFYGLSKRQTQELNSTLAACYDGESIDFTYRRHHYHRKMPRFSACLLTYHTQWLAADAAMFRRFLHCEAVHLSGPLEQHPPPDLTSLHGTIATVRQYADEKAELVATPQTYGLISPSESAYELLAQYQQELRFSPPHPNALINDWRTMAPTHALRLAATLAAWRHVASEPLELIQPIELDVDDTSSAVELMRWYGQQSASSLSPERTRPS